MSRRHGHVALGLFARSRLGSVSDQTKVEPDREKLKLTLRGPRPHPAARAATDLERERRRLGG